MLASAWRPWRATGSLTKRTQTRHLEQLFQRMEGEKNKSRRGWVIRMAGGTQIPGMLGTREAAVGSVKTEKEKLVEL